MIKCLHIPLNVPGSEQVGQEKGFRDVFDEYVGFDFLSEAGQLGNNRANDKLKQIIEQEKPDIIFAQLQETNIITPETWQEIKEKHRELWLTTWSGDARTYVPPGLASILPYFDIFYNATDQEALYKPYCKRYEFMPIAVDPTEVTTFKEVPGVPDVLFIGNHYGLDAFPNSRGRYNLCVALTKEFGDKFGVYGSGWPTGDINLLGPVAIKDQGSYYHAAKVVISIDHFNDMCYWSERRLWAIASGRPVVMEEHPGWKEHFMYHVTPFTEIAGCIDAVKALLLVSNHDTTGPSFIKEQHSWKQRAQQVKEDYERHKSKSVTADVKKQGPLPSPQEGVS